MESALRGGIALELGLGAMLLQRPDTATSVETPGAGLPLPHGPGGEMDPLGTVGLALLAYGLVQLLSKVVDKLPVWRAGDVAAARPPAAATPPGGDGGGFTAEDRKRLERVYEQAVADRQRLERLEESVREQLTVQQRLVGQALDDLRTVHAQLDNIVRKLRAVWTRIGRRRKDRG